MTATIHLVRHGAHGDVGRVLTGRGGDHGLAPLGEEQARWAAGQLRDVALVQCSPQRRTRETAAVIGAAFGCAPEVVVALDEINFGEWTGRIIADLDGDPAWHRWNACRATAQVPGGERMTDAVARAAAHLDALGQRDWPGALVCVSHSDIIRGVVAHYMGLPLDHLLRFDVDPGSVTTLVVGEWGGRLLSLNVRAV